MNITRIEVIPCRQPPVLAWCRIILDGMLVIHDVRVVRTGDGRRLVAMPCKSAKRPCDLCAKLIDHQARFCSHCGEPQTLFTPPEGKHHFDLVHPLTPEFRATINEAVLAAVDNEAGGQAQ